MEKHELFVQAIATEIFEKYDDSELVSIGMSIGGNEFIFKELYKAYLQNAPSYENNPMIGAKLEVKFNPEADEIIIKRHETNLHFTNETFLQYLNLISICFSEIYPLGSVVELDNEMFTEEFMEASTQEDAEESREMESTEKENAEEKEPLLAMITGRNVTLMEDFEDCMIDYLARLRPICTNLKYQKKIK